MCIIGGNRCLPGRAEIHLACHRKIGDTLCITIVFAVLCRIFVGIAGIKITILAVDKECERSKGLLITYLCKESTVIETLDIIIGIILDSARQSSVGPEAISFCLK